MYRDPDAARTGEQAAADEALERQQRVHEEQENEAKRRQLKSYVRGYAMALGAMAWTIPLIIFVSQLLNGSGLAFALFGALFFGAIASFMFSPLLLWVLWSAYKEWPRRPQ